MLRSVLGLSASRARGLARRSPRPIRRSLPARPPSASSPATSSGIAAPPPARARPTRAARWCCASRSPSAPAESRASSSTAARFAAGRARALQRVGQGAPTQALAATISFPRGRRRSPPLGRRPPFLSRLHKSAASPHLRRVLRQYELVEKVRSYDPDADEGLINRAYVFSMKAHGSQMRASGDPYFSHPIEVAGILTDLKLDDQTIVTAILHDTIEDTLATPEEIEQAVRQGRRPAGRRRHQASRRSRRSRRTSAPPRICASSCSRSATTSACCWSSSPTGCTTCARSITSRRRTSAAGSRARRWISTRRSPSASACTR